MLLTASCGEDKELYICIQNMINYKIWIKSDTDFFPIFVNVFSALCYSNDVDFSVIFLLLCFYFTFLLFNIYAALSFLNATTIGCEDP